jgi:threonine synthase
VSFLTGLECSGCGRPHDAEVVQQLCTACNSPLLARYDLAAAGRSMTRDSLRDREPTLWRYAELLPVRDPGLRGGLGEGYTPLIRAASMGSRVGAPRLLIKDDSVLPTGTFKARGAAVGVPRARELGVRRMIMPTNGNAGAAWAAYAARHGLQLTVVMPTGAPTITRTECELAGAQLVLVDGTISDAGSVVQRTLSSDPGLFDVSTLKEPYRVEGKKTIGFEFVEQLGWRIPDVVVYPTGGGVGLIGIHKAIAELQAVGLVHGTQPRYVAAQAAGCAPVVRAFRRGRPACEPWPDSDTVAFGINVPNPLGGRLVLAALAETAGTAVAVSDDEAVAAQRLCAESEGLYVCPETGVALAAVAKLREAGWTAADEQVLVVNTGTGLKYPV